MDLGPLRALTLDLNVSAHGLPVTVTRPAPDDAPISTSGIWVSPTTEDFTSGLDVQRRAPRRVLVLTKAAVPTVPKGTLILAPETAGGRTRAWRVDGVDRVEADHHRVVIVLDTNEDALLP